ncbi:hypothetical protein [uncultured Bacteroides sp.]|jgi:uncharacterized protein YjbJ (UPF0337 family)|uniref:hypothetical protein n=1 Tax=Bacteroides caccae TaxID=47678 RepID=UPI0025966B49|nr:hypothetical protein [uncultured Bacteroides sp.]
MAGLINTGIWGFISSAKATGRKILNVTGEEIDEWASTFVSGLSGWIIDKLGNAEFKSVFVRDKLITNEFVYNRIRVTEDEEIISSSIKIASYFDNEDRTFTVYPDLREGDINPLAENDLLMGYYHNPANSGVIYAVQKFTAVSDPSREDQSILLEPEDNAIPYRHMIVVRVGNLIDEDRQSFIRISSRTNCQYFYDGIDSWAAYDNPDNVKCTLGHADIGLIPAWAKDAVGSVRRWFGLIADGVIIRGTFILHNDKTIEDELNGRETQIRGDFEIREDGITGKWQEVIKYAKDASDSAGAAAGSAGVAGEYEKSVRELSSEFNVNYGKLSAEFTEKVTKETGDSLGAITSATEQATGTLQLTAKDFVLAFTDLVETKTQEATGEIDDAVEIHKSELNRTAQGLTDKFKETVTDAEGDIIKEIGTQVTQNARQWKVEVMGEDKDGNPNTILAAINADESGIKIEGERVQISGQLLVEAIMTTGINIDDKFIVSVENGKAKVTMKGEIYADSGTFSGFLKIPFKTFKEGAIPNAATGEYTVSDYFNLEAKGEDTATRLILNLPTDEKYIGTVLTVYDNPVKTRIAPIVEIKGRMYHPLNVDVYGLKLVTKIETGKGGVIQFIGVSRYDGCVWYVITDSLGESTRT